MQYGACASNVSGVWYCSVITNGVRKLAVILSHTMTPIPSHPSCWRMQHWARRSPGRCHTLWRPSWRYWQNHDSSENTTLFHCLWFQFRWRRAHWWRFWRRSGVRTCRWMVDVLERWWDWFVPGGFLEFQQLFARLSAIYLEGAATRSGVVTLSVPERGHSSTQFVSWYRRLRLMIIIRASWRIPTPPSSNPTARWRSLVVRRDMSGNRKVLDRVSHLSFYRQHGGIEISRDLLTSCP